MTAVAGLRQHMSKISDGVGDAVQELEQANVSRVADIAALEECQHGLRTDVTALQLVPP